MASVLLVALMAWGCSYTKDIADLDERVTNLEKNTIPSMYDELSKSIKDLQTTLTEDFNTKLQGLRTDLEGQIDEVDNRLSGEIADAIKDFNSKIDDVNGKIEEVDDRLSGEIDDVKGDLNDHLQDYADFYAEYESHVAEFESHKTWVEGEFDRVDGEIADLRDSLTNLEKDLNDKINDINENLNDNYYTKEQVDQRIRDLLKGYATMEKLAEEIANVNARIDQLVVALEQMKQDIANIQTSIDNINIKIEAINNTINGIIGRLDGIDTSIATLVNDIKALRDELASMRSEFDSKINALKNDIAKINSTINDYILPKLTEALTAAEDAMNRANDAWVKATQAYELGESIKNALGKYYGEVSLEEEIANILSRLDVAEKTQEEIQNRIDEVIEAYKNADEALAQMIRDSHEELSQRIIENTNAIAELRGDYNKLRNEFDQWVADFQERFQDAFDKALAEEMKEDGVIGKELKALHDELDAHIEAYKKKIAEIEKRLDDLESKVEDLSNRIQSIVFLPQYNDGKATSSVYVVKGSGYTHLLTDQQEITARFVVTPASYAKAFESSEGIEFRATPLSTRASFIAAEHQAVKCIDAEAGIVEVTGVFPGAATEYSVALAVKAAVKEEGTVNNDVVSDFALVKINEIDLGGEYTFVNKETSSNWSGRSVKHAWSAPAAETMETVFEGYELRLNDMTIEEAAEFYHIDADMLRPDFVFRHTLANKPLSDEEDWAKIFSVTTTPTKDYETITCDLLMSNNKENVGAKLEIATDLAFGDVNFSTLNLFTYEVVKEEVKEAVTYSEGWTYKREVDLSDDRLNPSKRYAQDFEIPFEKVLGEKLSGLVSEALDAEKSVFTNLQSSNTVPTLVFDNGLGIVQVTLKNYTYSFGSTYTFDIEFDNPYYDIKTPVTIELGALPSDTTFDLGAFETTLSSKTMTISPLGVRDAIKNLFNDAQPYYTDGEAMQKSLRDGASKADFKYTLGDSFPSVTLKPGTSLSPYFGEEVIEINPEILNSYEDVVKFSTEITTWFGVKYTFNAKVTFNEPQYKLVPNDHYVDIDGIVNVAGREQGGLYVLDAVYFADYFKIEGNVVDEIEVDFDAEKSTITDLREVPVVGNNIDRDKSVYNWGAKDRELIFNAQLYMKVGATRVKVGESYTITLKTPDPILRDKIVYGENVAYKEIGDIATANYWSTLEVYGILEPERNLINQSATHVSDMFTTPNLYQLDPSGTKIGNIKLYKAGTDEEVMDAYKYLIVDPAAGTVSFEFNNALWNYDIDARFEIGLDYYLDNNDPISIPAQITFRQQK